MRSDYRNRAGAALAVIVLQVAAAVYFLIDAIGESGLGTGTQPAPVTVVDVLVGLALLAGIFYAARTFLRLLDQAKRHEEALAVARGALADLIRDQFAQWALSPGEAEVALLALKGFAPGEIAGFRNSAAGTVRSQLSNVYAKAGVTGQPMLMAIFLDALLEDAPPGGRATGRGA